MTYSCILKTQHSKKLKKTRPVTLGKGKGRKSKTSKRTRRKRKRRKSRKGRSKRKHSKRKHSKKRRTMKNFRNFGGTRPLNGLHLRDSMLNNPKVEAFNPETGIPELFNSHEFIRLAKANKGMFSDEEGKAPLPEYVSAFPFFRKLQQYATLEEQREYIRHFNRNIQMFLSAYGLAPTPPPAEPVLTEEELRDQVSLRDDRLVENLDFAQ